jgi:hypothetical protein
LRSDEFSFRIDPIVGPRQLDGDIREEDVYRIAVGRTLVLG